MAMQRFRSFLYFALFYPGTIVYCIASLIAAASSPRALQRVVRGWSDFHHQLVHHLLGIRWEQEGVVPPGPYLVAIKHQAMVETIECLRLVDTPVVVMKQLYVQMPLLGAVMRRYGVIPVDREAGASALREMMALGKAAKAAGRPIVIFPEGTRVPVGQAPELRPGFAGLYRALGMPVVPVALDSGRLWPKGLLKRAGTIRVHIGETIPPGLKRDEIERRVHTALNQFELSAQASPELLGR
ncbi:1-acyl-sn-glycerol-3-phosphate acyltransferase [Sphingomonas sp. BN140010]|uniref:1-acyl-sn-glycerol-3-phosphate acyltransferase n=1 Tax=Sphingomonas arvum TaxID=2992113 RepID=A0ABT3JFC6_9SPHN|nr:lysophospholipid acyltransferase family protein [Sphingomonas sp. BN140010]MCW3797758.1 1-acyl-sn-glycerol-3-phosphate acyltransferase [Sphingomonas sp. BN140010]